MCGLQLLTYLIPLVQERLLSTYSTALWRSLLAAGLCTHFYCCSALVYRSQRRLPLLFFFLFLKAMEQCYYC